MGWEDKVYGGLDRVGRVEHGRDGVEGVGGGSRGTSVHGRVK